MIALTAEPERVATPGFDTSADEFRKMRDFESWYWWYIGQRNNLLSAIAQLGIPPGAVVLDAGCGTGLNLVEIERRFGYVGWGVDASRHASGFWKTQERTRRMVGSINELPFSECYFDLIVSVDVLGCSGVDIRRTLQEFNRTLKPGGAMVLLVPAYQWMLSRHDRAVGSAHRFFRRELLSLVRNAGFDVDSCSYRFAITFPVVAAMRLLRKSSGEGAGEQAKSDLFCIPRWLNTALRGLISIEHAICKFVSPPFGSTIMLTARRPAR